MMSTDPAAAMGRLDAAVEESARPRTGPSHELADLAAAIERIESLIAAGVAQGPDGTAAVERMSDIAYALHGHEVETSLCDTLDAAVREINGGALKDGTTERTQQAAELLRQLSRRVHEMIAQSQANQRSAPPALVNVVQTSSTAAQRPMLDEGDGEEGATDEGSFKTDVPEDDEFALVVAALTAALPSLAEFGTPVAVPPTAFPPDSAPPHGALQSSNALLLDEVLPLKPSTDGVADEDLAAGALPRLGEDFLRELMPSKPAAAPSADVASSAQESASEALPALPAPKAAADSAHDAGAHSSGALADHETRLPRGSEAQQVAAVVDPASVEAPDEDASAAKPPRQVAPDDDPGDLFEAMMPAPSIAPKSERTGEQTGEKVSEPVPALQAALATAAPFGAEPLEPQPTPPQRSGAASAAPAQPQPVSRPLSSDPLGPVRALSEEETIALFS